MNILVNDAECHYLDDEWYNYAPVIIECDVKSNKHVLEKHQDVQPEYYQDVNQSRLVANQNM